MKETIGFIYKELKDNFVNTVRSEPLFRIDLEDDGYVAIRNYKTKDTYMFLGNPATEIKRKRLVSNWASNKKMVYVDVATWENIRRRYGVKTNEQPKVEIKNNLKVLAANARIWASKLDELTDLIEETVSESVYDTCCGAMGMFRTMAEELDKLEKLSK